MSNTSGIDGFVISTDRERLNTGLIHEFLAHQSYWATGRGRELVERSIANSLCFGVYKVAEAETKQVGFARVITDYATFAYIADVFILEEYRGLGLAKWLIRTIRGYPELQGLRRWVLATKDAHGLYRQFGFKELSAPERWMEVFGSASNLPPSQSENETKRNTS